MTANKKEIIISIASLCINVDTHTLATIKSASQFASDNKEITFNHFIVCPNNTNDFDKEHLESSNYKIIFLKDSGSGIYNAFNIAVNSSEDNSYIIFLSAGDVFVPNVYLNQKPFLEEYSLIAFATKIIGKRKEFIYHPSKKGYLRNSIPHSSLFTKVSSIKEVGFFPLDLGSAADFYVTSSILRKYSSIHIDKKLITTFNLGGVSNSIKSYKFYVMALRKMQVNTFKIFYLSIRKLLSYIKYKI